MKWTKGRLKEKECLEWFRPGFIKGLIREQDWEIFFNKSERGKDPDVKTIGYEIILESKKWRDIQLNMWQEGVLDGSVPYFVLLGGEDKSEIPPRVVINFMKKDMFGGIDSELIESLYKQIQLQ